MKTKNKTNKSNTLLTTLLIAMMLVVVMFSFASAQTDVDVDALNNPADCYWSAGPGSELYVPSGAYCILTGGPPPLATYHAQNTPGVYTDYAIIVYPGGTLQIGDDAYMGDTPALINGDMLIMGTLKIGDDDVMQNSTYNASLGINGDITVLGDFGYMYTAPNIGTGYNTITNTGTTYIGDADSGGKIALNDDNANYSFSHIETYATFEINDGIVDIDSLFVFNANGGTSLTTIANGATLNIKSYQFCGTNLYCPIVVGLQSNPGAANLKVEGILNTDNFAPPAPSDQILYSFGTPAGGGGGVLTVETTGVVNIQDSTTFRTPPYTDPDTYLYTYSESPYGILIKGDFNAPNMYTLNYQGDFTVNSGGGGATANVGDYIQFSGLTVASGDTMTIEGTADIDGDGDISGTLYVNECTKIQNDVTEDFNVSGKFDTNTTDAGCDLTNTITNDGLNVQGTNSTFSVDNGADVDVGQDMRVLEGGVVDANGFIIIEDILYVVDGGSMSMQDTDTGDSFEADNLVINPSAGGASSALSVEDSSVFDLNVGSVKLGTSGSSGGGSLTVNGTVNVPTSSTDDFKVGDMGWLTIESDGVVNADAGSGLFLIEGGIVTVRGLAGNPGKLHIADQELQMDNATTDAYLQIGTSGVAYGELTSEATPASNLGFDYNEGYLDIEYHGTAIFADEIDIDTSDPMTIGGQLIGTDNINIGCDKGVSNTCKVEPSGEIKVVGTGTPQISVTKTFDLLGKLNGDDGAGNVVLDGTGPGNITSIGTASEDSYAYIIANDLDIANGTKIDVSEFVNCYEPTGTPTYGGSYGGEGGGGNTTTFGAVKYKTAPIYPGTPNPVGMCGFDGSGNKTRNGGGAIYIEVHNDLNLNNSGEIIANGQDSTTGAEGGAGSGGLIVIDHAIGHGDTGADFVGGTSAKITANGGDGTGTLTSYGGGGGRIVIDSIQFDIPDDDNAGTEPHYQYKGILNTYGGHTNGVLVTGNAAAGTIALLGDNNNPNGTLIVDAYDYINSQYRYPEATRTAIIQNVGDIVFDRMYAKDGGDIEYVTAPSSNPISCYASGSGSTVDLGTGTCTTRPDKPDTLYINNSSTGALLGDEPWTNDVGGTTVTTSDLDPVFSIIHRNPIVSSDVDKLWVQLTSDPSKFTTAGSCLVPADCLWDAQVTLDEAISRNTRTSKNQFEYAGSALSAGTTYYIRIAYIDDTFGQGLWNHMDMGEEYKFTTASTYYDIDSNCNDTTDEMIITQNGLSTGDSIKIGGTGRYGYGTCEFTINTNNTSPGWKLLFGFDPLTGSFSDVNGTYTIDQINNATDYVINTLGTTNDEEYGWNITNFTGSLGTYVNTDGTNSFSDTSKFFNVEDAVSPDEIMDATSAVSGDTFDLYMHLNVEDYTPADNYSMINRMTLTTGP